MEEKINIIMEQNLFLRAVERDEIIPYFLGKGEYFLPCPRTPYWGYEDKGEHFYVDSVTKMENCVRAKLLSERNLYDVLDRSFTLCLRRNPTIDVFYNAILPTIDWISEDKDNPFKQDWIYSQNLIDSIILYWRGKLKERNVLLQVKNKTEEIESQLKQIQKVQKLLNWINENLMKGKLDEICKE